MCPPYSYLLATGHGGRRLRLHNAIRRQPGVWPHAAEARPRGGLLRRLRAVRGLRDRRHLHLLQAVLGQLVHLTPLCVISYFRYTLVIL